MPPIRPHRTDDPPAGETRSRNVSGRHWPAGSHRRDAVGCPINGHPPDGAALSGPEQDDSERAAPRLRRPSHPFKTRQAAPPWMHTSLDHTHAAGGELARLPIGPQISSPAGRSAGGNSIKRYATGEWRRPGTGRVGCLDRVRTGPRLARLPAARRARGPMTARTPMLDAACLWRFRRPFRMTGLSSRLPPIRDDPASCPWTDGCPSRRRPRRLPPRSRSRSG